MKMAHKITKHFNYWLHIYKVDSKVSLSNKIDFNLVQIFPQTSFDPQSQGGGGETYARSNFGEIFTFPYFFQIIMLKHVFFLAHLFFCNFISQVLIDIYINSVYKINIPLPFNNTRRFYLIFLLFYFFSKKPVAVYNRNTDLGHINLFQFPKF